MQINNSPRFIQKIMIGLIASSAGAFVALPSVAMPTTTTATPEAALESVEGVEAIEGTPLAAPGKAPTEALTEPTAAETLPTAEADETDELSEESAAEADEAVAETEALEETPLVEADEPTTMPVAEDDATDLEPVAEDDATDLEPVAEDDASELEPMAEDDSEVDPVAEDPTAEGAEEEVAAEEMNTEEFTISELTSSSDSFEVLAAAIEAADLTEVLGGEGPFTIFAPTDEAFEALPEGAVDQLLLPENKEVLVQVLTYHVVPGAVLSTDLESGDIATVEGSDITIDVADPDTVTVNNANVVFADVAASNGVIHVIDRVILPPAPEADADVEAPAPVQ